MVEETSSLQVELTNTGRAARVLYDVKGRIVNVPYGETRTANFVESQAQDLVNSSKRGDTLKAKFVGEAAQVQQQPASSNPGQQQRAPAPGANPTGGGGYQGRPLAHINSDKILKEASQKLLEDYANGESNLSYNDFVAQAKTILGGRWPSGNPKKIEIIEALELRAKGDEE